MVYTTKDLIREKTEYTESDISDAALDNIITEATSVINSEINTYVIREKATYIDNTRQNKIDGTNKTFYVKNSIVNNFGDDNNDGELTISDIKIELEDNEDIITETTVSTIDVEGSYVLNTSPPSETTVALYTTYKYTHYDITIPDQLITLLSTYLASSYAVLVVESGLPSTTRLGNISVTVPVANTKYTQFTNRYLDLLKRVKIPSNRPRTKTYTHRI